MRRHRLNVYLPPELLQQVGDFATRRKISKSMIVNAALASFLSPDGAERSEAALVRRLDLLTRQVQRLERTNRGTMETLALFVRFFLTVTPPLPPDAMASAQASGKQRYEGLIDALGQRLKKGAGRGLLDEIPEDVEPTPRSNGGGAGQGDLPA
jgi:hypothetical protein